MDDPFDLVLQTKDAQERARNAGLLETTATLDRLCRMIAGLTAQHPAMDRVTVISSTSPAPPPACAGREKR